MGTNAIIIKKLDNGNFKGVWVNFDGYLEHTGKILLDNYNNDESIDELLNLGNLSGIDATLESCSAYERDYRRKGQHAKINSRINNFGSASYIYLWKDEKWFVSIRSDDFIELTTELY